MSSILLFVVARAALCAQDCLGGCLAGPLKVAAVQMCLFDIFFVSH